MHKIRNVSIGSCLALGLVALTVSTIFDGGFFKGFFQGAAFALLALAAFLVFSAIRARRSSAGDSGTGSGADDGMWLPSRDEER